MKISKLGDGLGIVFTPDDAARLGLKEGDIVEVKRLDITPPLSTDPAERKAARDRMRSLRGMIPADFKFDRDEANER